MLNRISAGILAAFVLLTAGLCAQADERILKFVSDIDVASNGTLTVTETIAVSAEGDQIKRGIFRDIPLAVEGERVAGFDTRPPVQFLPVRYRLAMPSASCAAWSASRLVYVPMAGAESNAPRSTSLPSASSNAAGSRPMSTS